METIRQDKTERWVLTDYCVCMVRACKHSSVRLRLHALRLRGQPSGCSSMNASPVNAHASGPDHACPDHACPCTCKHASPVNALANMPAQCVNMLFCLSCLELGEPPKAIEVVGEWPWLLTWFLSCSLGCLLNLNC